MKMRYIIGALVIVAVGAGVYYLCKKNKNENSDIVRDEKVSKDEKTTDNNTNVPSEDSIEKEIALTEEKKAEMQEAIMARHQEAAIQMESSLKNILDETPSEKVISENDDDLTEMDDALDKLLDD